ncbi:Testis-expressed sequence 2 protein [Nymphaea thermarum]|nr:Testis-expressed sequence 2 protein [Nymphaea thermarum]
MILLFLCYLAGAVTVLIVEAGLLLYALDRLSRKQKPESLVQQETDSVPELAPDHSVVSLLTKKGVIWVLEPEKVPKIHLSESNQQKSKREVFDIAPVRRFARLEGQALILRDAEGGQSSIRLDGCTVAAVSASNLPTRKWAKRYPIKLEKKNSVVYNGSEICYIYVETSWEKESWCRALRLASRMDKTKQRWYMKISQEFRQYVTTLNAQYPFFSKPPAAVFTEPTDRSQRLDGSSRVRLFLKKLAKKAAKVGSEGRMENAPFLASEEKRSSNKFGATDITPYGASSKAFSVEKNNASSSQKDLTFPVGVEIGASDQVSVSSDMEQDSGPSCSLEGCQEKPSIDEGTLCWNVLLSRLFFDVKRSQEIVNFMQARIQKALSNIRTPSYVGGVTCSNLDLGNLPPYVHNMRVLPMDMNDVWTVEVDIEYSGGAVLYIETRLEVGAPDFQKGIIGASLEPNSERDANTDLLEGLEELGDQLGLSQDASESDGFKKGTEDDSKDGKSFKSSSWRTGYVSRLKSRLSSLADQVSQMPLSLAVRVLQLRGTVRIHIKPPPSDQIWIAFTTMPQIEWDLDSHVGDHKVTSAQIALFIGNRIKAALKNSMVLPNCEYIRIPWMVAEKDDWVQRDVAPFSWLHQEASDSERTDAPDTQLERTKSRPEPKKGSKGGSGRHPKDGGDMSDADSPDYQLGKSKNRQESGKGSTESFFGFAPADDAEKSGSLGISQTSDADAPDVVCPSLPTTVTSSSTEQSLRDDITSDLKVPLLKREDSQGSYATGSSRQLVSDGCGAVPIPARAYSSNSMADSEKSKKFGRRARMLDIGKKMGEKLEEKKRHLEERGRLIVEKMRGNENLN